MSNRTRPLVHPRATLYARLSNAATEANLSKDGMLADLHALAGRLGADVVAVHLDDGISGSVRDRPEFLAWLADAREGRATIMLAWSGDRLTREGINAAAMVLDAVEGKDERTGKIVRPPVRFVSVDDGLDSEEGDAFRWRFVIAAEVARGERTRMVSRNTARAGRILAQGRHVGRIPFGYRLDPEHPAVLVVHPEEADALREAARRVLDGTAPAQVARWLNARGLVPRLSGEWSRKALLSALLNPANAGQPLRAGAAAREPILSFATVAELRRRYAAEAAVRKGGVRGSLTMLSGILRCHDCGRLMRASSRRYVCRTKPEGGPCGGTISMLRSAADDVAEEVYLARWGRMPELRSEVILSDAAERDALEREHAEIMRRLATAPDASDFARLQELTALRAELDAAPADRVARLVPTGRTWADAWQDATSEDRRDMLLRAYDQIIMRPRVPGQPRLFFVERPEVAELSPEDLI